MRNPAPLSPTSDESSLFSSFDALALSSSSRHSSAAVASTRGRSSLNPTDESYEVISRRNPSQRSSLSLVSASSSRQSTSDDGRRTPSERSGPSKSAARRARQRALEANRSSEVVVAKRPTATLSASGDKVPQNFKPQASPSGALIDKQAIAPNKTGNKAPQQQFKLSTYLSVPSSSDESEPVGTYRKTRRGGKKNRSRLDKAAVRDQLTIGEEAGSSAPPVISSGGDDEYSEDGASRFLDEELDEDEEDEVEGMSALGGGEESVMGTPRSSAGRRKIEGSVMSSEDAKTSIDSFLSSSAAFMSDKANKLGFWQALCVELGLVQMDGDDDLPDLPRSRGDNSGSPPSGNRSLTSSRASTPGPRLPPLPQSLRQARAILKEKAHINLADYLAARAAVGTVDYAEMLHPSSAAMIRYTKKNGKFVQLGMVKTEWLEPLLRDFGFKRSRIAAAADPRR